MVRLISANDGAPMSEQARQAYEKVQNSRGYVTGPVAVMLPYAPEVASRVAHLGNALRFEGLLTRPQVELATITATRAVSSDYPWTSHVAAARKVGIPEAVIQAVESRGPLDGLGEEEALIIQFGREVVEQRRLSQQTYDRALAHFGERGLLELATLIGYYVMMSCIITTIELEPPADAPRLPR